MLEGECGAACQLAMKLIVQYAGILQASELLSVTCAHIDGCLYHGQASLDFAQKLQKLGGKVRVPTTLNVSSLDRLHPELYRGDPQVARAARELMDAYEALGCEPTWTCAPYQTNTRRPAFGDQIAWAESNAIVFANSVLGARTNRYGDFLDICAALTGRVPNSGLHNTAARRGQIVFPLTDIDPAMLADDILYPLVGFIIGERSGTSIPAIVGLPDDTSEDDLKALGATSASSGSVALFHAVGITPEAPTLEAALQNRPAERTIPITDATLRHARDRLNTLAVGSKLTAVSLGTPHFSVPEFARLVALTANRRCDPGVEFFVNTSREVLERLRGDGAYEELIRFGARIVVDTCTYITPILREVEGGGAAMTNSGKWAHYAPANLGVGVALGSLSECVTSAVEGRVCRE